MAGLLQNRDLPTPHILCKIWVPCCASEASQFEVMHDWAEERNDDDAHEQAMFLLNEGRSRSTDSVALAPEERTTHSGSHPAEVDALFAQLVAQLLRPLSWASTPMLKIVQRGSWRPLLDQL